jgi:hypothetical protein
MIKMNKDDFVKAIIKTFQGVEVTNYPCKGTRLFGGGKPENSLPLGRIEKENKLEKLK